MAPFDPSLPSIEEDSSNGRGTSHSQYNAKRSNKRHNRPRRNVASIAQGPGGFHHPKVRTPRPNISNMADADSTAQPEAAPAAHEHHHPPQTSQSLRLPNIDASTAASAGLPPSSDDPKLDPAGFFTLVNNTKFGDTSSAGQQTHHPRVQYIFADDDPAVLTAALADAHARNTASTSSARSQTPREHTVLVDVEPITDPKTGKHTGGWKVASASSISGDFAVTDAKLTRMEDSSSAAGGGPKSPRANTDTDSGDSGGALMLKIDGVEMTDDDPAVESLRGSQQSGDRSVSGDKEDYAALIEDFDKQMNIIKKIVAAGEARAAKNPEAAEEQHHEQHEGALPRKHDAKESDGEESG